MRLLTVIQGEDGGALLVRAGEPANAASGGAASSGAGEPLIEAGPGWHERIAERDAGKPVWLCVRDIAEVRLAGENALGAVIDLPENPDHAQEWTAAHEGGLASKDARKAARSINSRCAVRLELPQQLDQAVGLIERLRQAGASDVVVGGEAASDRRYLQELAAEFDDDEVRDAAAARDERLAPLVAAIERRGPRAPAPAAVAPKRRSRFSARIQRGQEGAVRRMSDRQLGLLIGNSVGVRTLMRTMAARFRPEHAAGFTGDVEFTLHTARGPAVWTIECGPAEARARRGGSEDAALHVEAELADFLRIGTGEIAAPAAVLSGKLHVRGDFALALRMGEMFDGPSIV